MADFWVKEAIGILRQNGSREPADAVAALAARLASLEDSVARRGNLHPEQWRDILASEVAALKARLAEADVLIAKGLAVVHDFLPNIGRCVLQDYQRMNEFCCEAAARAADSATHRENERE